MPTSTRTHRTCPGRIYNPPLQPRIKFTRRGGIHGRPYQSPANNEPTPERKKREMKRTTLKTRLWALAATLLLLVSLLAMPVSAVKGGTTTFNKYLILNENAHVPDADFTFKIAPGTPVPADSASGMPAIYAGIGAPTVFEAAFSPDDEAITTVADNEVTLESGEEKAKKQVIWLARLYRLTAAR